MSSDATLSWTRALPSVKALGTVLGLDLPKMRLLCNARMFGICWGQNHKVPTALACLLQKSQIIWGWRVFIGPSGMVRGASRVLELSTWYSSHLLMPHLCSAASRASSWSAAGHLPSGVTNTAPAGNMCHCHHHFHSCNVHTRERGVWSGMHMLSLRHQTLKRSVTSETAFDSVPGSELKPLNSLKRTAFTYMCQG